jgi:hypothetical protein
MLPKRKASSDSAIEPLATTHPAYTHKSFPRKYRAISLFQRATSPAPSSAMYLSLSLAFNESRRSSILWIHSTRSLTRSSSYCLPDNTP